MRCPLKEHQLGLNTSRSHGLVRALALLPRDQVISRSVDEEGWNAITALDYVSTRTGGPDSVERGLRKRAPVIDIWVLRCGLPLVGQPVQDHR